MKYSALEKHREAAREMEMRKTVYARLRMSPSEAKRKIEIMEEIANDYRALADKERLL
jgi:hypothetical protein